MPASRECVFRPVLWSEKILRSLPRSSPRTLHDYDAPELTTHIAGILTTRFHSREIPEEIFIGKSLRRCDSALSEVAGKYTD
jgi:hypothetical protein